VSFGVAVVADGEGEGEEAILGDAAAFVAVERIVPDAFGDDVGEGADGDGAPHGEGLAGVHLLLFGAAGEGEEEKGRGAEETETGARERSPHHDLLLIYSS